MANKISAALLLLDISLTTRSGWFRLDQLPAAIQRPDGIPTDSKLKTVWIEFNRTGLGDVPSLTGRAIAVLDRRTNSF